MNAFRENYKTYYSLMNAAGLWPHDRTVLAWIRRVAFGLLAASLVVNQIMTLRNLEPTLYDFTVLISYCTPILMYNIRYVSSILTFPTIKYVLNSLEHDYVTLKDPMELKILMRHSLLAKRIVQMYVALTCSGLLFIIATLGVPTIQRSDRQLRSLYVTGYFFNERSIHSNLTCLHIILGSIHGLTSFICTEGTLTVFSTYVSGLLDVASYRMQNAVGDAASSNETDVLKIRPAVEMHRRAIVSTIDDVRGWRHAAVVRDDDTNGHLVRSQYVSYFYSYYRAGRCRRHYVQHAIICGATGVHMREQSQRTISFGP
ncbi:uncharacterized protein LOC117221066 isoform X6 [Megalopta genalis]|uniref:uncharacterized protein LOC117221066 isoform X6 n=1 Tax=Megalopta genalis TaxID=115081 RepID=UPI003FD3110B